MKKRVTKREINEKHTRVRQRHTTQVSRVKTNIKIDNLEDVEEISKDLIIDIEEPITDKKKRKPKKSEIENEEDLIVKSEIENNEQML